MLGRKLRGVGLVLVVAWLLWGLGRLLAVAQVAPGGAETDICGPISADTVWTAAGSPYVVTCDTSLEPGIRLEIEPGVAVRFDPGLSLTVQGTLVASGTQTQPVTFTATGPEPAPGDWLGLRFRAGSSASRLAWCLVEYATVGLSIYAAPGSTVAPTFERCTVRHSSSHGIVIEGYASGCDAASARPAISGCTVEYSGGCGLYGYGHGNEQHGCVPAQNGSVGGTLSASTIHHNQGTGIWLRADAGYYSHGNVWIGIERNRIYDNGGYGLYMVGEDPIHPLIENNALYRNDLGGLRWEATFDYWDLPIVNNTIVDNGGHGLLSLRPAGGLQVTNNLFANNGGYGLSCLAGASPQLSHNDVWTNTLGEYDVCTPGTGDLVADPLLAGVAAGDLHLAWGSPCIDAGITSGAPAVDIDGIERPKGVAVDVGAHEFWAAKLDLRQDGRQVAEGEQHEFGRVALGASRPVTFSLGNLGNRSLVVQQLALLPSGHFNVVLSGTLPLTVAPGLSTTFQVRLVPAATGRHTATLSIDYDGAAGEPYTFQVAGWGVQTLAGLALTGPITGLVGSDYFFGASAAPPDVTLPITYTWRASGQVPLTRPGGVSDTVLWAWNTPGLQAITVTAANCLSAITSSRHVTLYAPLQAGFTTAPISGPVPLSVVFANTSAGMYTASRWDFGDGLTSSLTSPVHIYRAVGLYTVSLEIEGPAGRDTLIRPALIDVLARHLYLPLILHE